MTQMTTTEPTTGAPEPRKTHHLRTALLATGGGLLALAVLGGVLGAGSTKTAKPAARTVASAPATHAPAAKPAPTVTVTKTATPAPAAPAPAQAAADPAPKPAAADPAPKLTNASAIVDQFYEDINSGDYAAAWALGGANIGGTDYASWVVGYATTASLVLGTASEFGGTTVYAALYATQTDGTLKSYEGTYTVANGVITAASNRAN